MSPVAVQIAVALGELLVDLQDLALEVRLRLLLARKRIRGCLRRHALADADDPVAPAADVAHHRTVQDEAPSSTTALSTRARKPMNVNSPIRELMISA